MITGYLAASLPQISCKPSCLRQSCISHPHDFSWTFPDGKHPDSAGRAQQLGCYQQAGNVASRALYQDCTDPIDFLPFNLAESWSFQKRFSLTSVKKERSQGFEHWSSENRVSWWRSLFEILINKARLRGASQETSKMDQHRRWFCFLTSSAAKNAGEQQIGGRERVYSVMEEGRESLSQQDKHPESLLGRRGHFAKERLTE